MSELDWFGLYVVLSLIVSLVGIHIYREDMNENPHKDIGAGIALVAMAWPFFVVFGAFMLPIVALGKLIRWAYHVDL